MTFLGLLLERFDEFHARPAVTFPGGVSYRYDQLKKSAMAVSQLFLQHRLDPGERLALCLSDKHAFLLAHLGALFARLVPLPLNPDFTESELEYFLRDSGAAAIVVDSVTDSKVDRVLYGSRPILPCQQLKADHITAIEPRSVEMPDKALPGDPALMLYSSGTTGEPKGVVHTQDSLSNAVDSLARYWEFSPEDKLVNVLPLFHIHGLSFATHVSWISGSWMKVGDRFHPRKTLDLVGQSSVFMGVPPYYYSWLDRKFFYETESVWKNIRLVTCGSAPIRPEVLPRLEGVLGQLLVNRYGMTESHVISSLPVPSGISQEHSSEKLSGSVGVAIPGIEIRLASRKSSHETGDEGLGSNAQHDSDVGEVYVRGPNLFKEYWNRSEATRLAIDSDGWFATGDLGRLDGQQRLTLVGRSKDLIIVGGFNVYPAVVEKVVSSCPGVREAAVFALDDLKRGQRVAVAAVKDHEGSVTERQIQSFCKQHLISYQCPAVVTFVDQLPRNTMGKILRRILQQQFE